MRVTKNEIKSILTYTQSYKRLSRGKANSEEIMAENFSEMIKNVNLHD